MNMLLCASWQKEKKNFKKPHTFKHGAQNDHKAHKTHGKISRKNHIFVFSSFSKNCSAKTQHIISAWKYGWLKSTLKTWETVFKADFAFSRILCVSADCCRLASLQFSANIYVNARMQDRNDEFAKGNIYLHYYMRFICANKSCGCLIEAEFMCLVSWRKE